MEEADYLKCNEALRLNTMCSRKCILGLYSWATLNMFAKFCNLREGLINLFKVKSRSFQR